MKASAKFLTVAFLAVALAGSPVQKEPQHATKPSAAHPPRGKSIIDFEGPVDALPLYQGAWTNNLELVQAQVAKNPNVIHSEQDRVMEIAAEGGSLPVLHYLHDQGGNLAANNFKPLLLAVSKGDMEMFEYILVNLPPLSQPTKDALMVRACYLDSLPMVKRIHTLGGRADVYTGLNDSGVSAAAKHGSGDILPWLLNTLKANSHGRKEDALRQATDHNRLDSVRLFLAQGPAPHEPPAEWNKALNDALKLAVKGGDFASGKDGYIKVVAALLEYGANPGAIDADQMARTEKKYPGIADLLKKKKTAGLHVPPAPAS